MKLHQPEILPGSDPVMRVGQRQYKDRKGREQTTDTYYAVYCLHGRERCESLKTSNKQLAGRRALEILLRIDRGEGTPVPARAEMSEVSRAYLDMQGGRNRAPTTLAKYMHTLTTFVAWCMVHFRRPAALFTEQHFWQWHKTLIEDGYSEKTRYDRAIIVKQLFKWAAKVRLIPSNPLDKCSLSEPTPTEQPCFTPHQVSAILTGADPHESAIYAVMAYGGLRFGEMRDLNWSAVAMPPDEPGFLTISRGGSNGTTKSRRTRRIPLHPDLRPTLEKLPRRGERVFYSRPSRRYPKGDHRVGESHLLKSLKRLCHRLGFANPDQYKLHTFRHAFASMCARNSVAYKYALECPDTQWKLIFVLCRYGGLRCPSEHLKLKWGDVNWDDEQGFIWVHSPKTEHIRGKEKRKLPLFPEIRPHLLAAFSEATEGEEYIIRRSHRNPGTNLRTQFMRILERAGIEPWPKLFHNLRGTRETELAIHRPLPDVCAWIGNSVNVAQKHYLQRTGQAFADAVKYGAGPAAHNPAQQGPAQTGSGEHSEATATTKTTELASLPTVADTCKVGGWPLSESNRYVLSDNGF